MRELILVSAYIDALPPTLAVMLRDDAPPNINTAINLATSYDESRNFVMSNVDHVGSGNDRESRHGSQHNSQNRAQHILLLHNSRDRTPGLINRLVNLGSHFLIVV